MGDDRSKDDQLRSWGLALLVLGMAVGAIGRALHASDSVHIGMSVASLALSLAAIGIFIKVSKRRSVLVATLAAVVMLALGAAFALTRK